ncbi:Voltage-dependent anion-selective channel protein 1 [Plecturocebus cupreus]
MPVPPTYADLGKSAKDAFTIYGFVLIKLDLKTKSENGLEFTSSRAANTEITKVMGSLETKFGSSVYQKVNKKLETAVNLTWTAVNSNTYFRIAAKYPTDPEVCFSAKVNNSSLIGLGYTQTLKPVIKMTLSAILDGKNINACGHKLGLGLEFQA